MMCCLQSATAPWTTARVTRTCGWCRRKTEVTWTFYYTSCIIVFLFDVQMLGFPICFNYYQSRSLHFLRILKESTGFIQVSLSKLFRNNMRWYFKFPGFNVPKYPNWKLSKFFLSSGFHYSNHLERKKISFKISSFNIPKYLNWKLSKFLLSSGLHYSNHLEMK